MEIINKTMLCNVLIIVVSKANTILIKKDHKYNLGKMVLTNFLALFESSVEKVVGAITAEKKIKLPIKKGIRKLINLIVIMRKTSILNRFKII